MALIWPLRSIKTDSHDKARRLDNLAEGDAEIPHLKVKG